MKAMIVGLGLIGGSFALALRDHALAEEILGVERSPETAQEALALGLADRIVGFEEGIAEADLIVLATPVDTLPLLAAGSEVLWVCGSGFAEGLAPDETTTQILQMEQET